MNIFGDYESVTAIKENLSTQEKQEYIKELIAGLESLRSIHMLYVTFDIGLVAITISGFIFTEFRSTITDIQRIVLSLSLILVTLSAGFYVAWIGIIEGLRARAVDWMVTLDIDEARQIHYPRRGAYRKYGWTAIMALVCMLLGISGYLAFLLMLLANH